MSADERTNLLAVAKLVVRDVIYGTQAQQSVSIDEGYCSSHKSNPNGVSLAVQRLLTVIEHCLCHGLRRDFGLGDLTSSAADGLKNDLLRSSTAVLRRARDQVVITANSLMNSSSYPNPWPVVLLVEKLLSQSDKISQSVLTMTELRTGLGRTRVWLRHALMRKSLGEYFRVIIDNQNPDTPSNNHSTIDKFSMVSEFNSLYYPEALLLNNEGIVLTGLLASLKSIDFCFDLKDNVSRFDSELQAVPYSAYLQMSLDKLEHPNSKENSSPRLSLSSVIDQKNFLEDICDKLRYQLDQSGQTKKELEQKISSVNESLDLLKLENQSLKITLDHFRKDRQLTQTESPDSSRTENGDDETIKCITHLESALKAAYKSNEEKSDLIETLRTNLSEANIRTQQLTRHLSECQSSLEHKQTLVKQLESKTKGMATIIDQMKERITVLGNDKSSFESTCNQLKQQLADLQAHHAHQETELQSERTSRHLLESQLASQTVELERLRALSEELSQSKAKVQELQSEISTLRTRCEGQERSLSEMAAIVNFSKLEAENLRELHNSLKDAQWTDDSAVSKCNQCQVQFSVSRRRHHCRNCGSIFCHDCSSRTMPLPSSAKPVRVCDTCHSLLLNRYAAK